jgi:hypothetical protein
MKKLFLISIMMLTILFVKAQEKADSILVQFVGSGEIQKSISAGTDIPASTGIGLQFRRLFPIEYKFFNVVKISKIELDININIASNVDTISAILNKDNTVSNTRDFGSFMLSPVTSKQALLVNYRMHFRNQFGVQANIISSNRVWENRNDTLFRDSWVSCLSMRIGLFYEFIPRIFSSNDYSVTFGLDLSQRSIFGDIYQKSHTDFRKNILQTTDRKFFGFEPNIILRLKNIRAEVSFPYMISDNDISGLTNGQLILAIKFIGGFPLKLN